MCSPLVTIGIINYNCIKFLETCIRSYLSQSYKNIEIIIIDDCSTDGSIELLKRFEQEEQNIRCIYHESNSGGPSQGIREIIDQAQGKYFQWIASDDYVDSTAIEKFVDNLEKTNNDYVYCNFNITNRNNDVTGRWNYTLPTLSAMVYRIFAKCSGVMPMNGLYRLDFFHRNGLSWNVYRNNDHSSDTINSMDFIRHGMTYGLINEGLIYYRVHEDNCSHNMEDRIRTSLTVYDYIIKNFHEGIYMPNIAWDKCSNREQRKNYEIALFFYERALDYMKLKGIPNHLRWKISKEKLKESLAVFAQEGMEYIGQGLTQGPALEKELRELEQKYISLFK